MRGMRSRTGQSSMEYFLLATLLALLTVGAAMRGFLGHQEVKDDDGKVVVKPDGMLKPAGAYFEAARNRIAGKIAIEEGKEGKN